MTDQLPGVLVLCTGNSVYTLPVLGRWMRIFNDPQPTEQRTGI